MNPQACPLPHGMIEMRAKSASTIPSFTLISLSSNFTLLVVASSPPHLFRFSGVVVRVSVVLHCERRRRLRRRHRPPLSSSNSSRVCKSNRHTRKKYKQQRRQRRRRRCRARRRRSAASPSGASARPRTAKYCGFRNSLVDDAN
jgi:hypothetical protein